MAPGLRSRRVIVKSTSRERSRGGHAFCGYRRIFSKNLKRVGRGITRLDFALDGRSARDVSSPAYPIMKL